MKKIPVFYDTQMVVEDNQPSPSAKKPRLLVEQWIERGLPIELMPVTPLLKEQFYLSHEKNHVDAILNLKKPNGMDTISQELSDSLKWTSGSLLSAARYALNHSVAVSPTSGFHHAEYSSAMGFCTFNGLMITAQVLLDEGLVYKVGILDFDQHYGNGTDNIINYFKLHDKVINITAQKYYKTDPNHAATFFARLPRFLETLKYCGLIIYQAGADCHINDPYGGFLTSEQMKIRDQEVFKFCKVNQIPLVWNLAGGYQEEKINGEVSIQKVLDLHNTTMDECIKIYL